MKQLIKRIYHPYYLWEEVKTNMYGYVENRNKSEIDCIEFLNDTEAFGNAMLAVVNEWKFSCEHNLTNIDSNRRAWLGQAACAYAINIPEDVVRFAWFQISTDKQNAANQKAEEAIMKWEETNKEIGNAQKTFEL